MEKILVIQTAFIGDAILTLPMLQKLKSIYKDSEVHVMSIPLTSSVFNSSPAVDKVIELDKRGKHKSLFATIRFAKSLRNENYTRLYSPHRSFRTSLLVLFSDIRETYGFNISSFNHIYKYLVDYNYQAHEVQRNLDLIGADYTEESWKIIPELNISNEVKDKIDHFYHDNKLNEKGTAIVAPGSIWNTKKYPSEYYREIIEFFVKENLNVVLIGSQTDNDLCELLSSGFNSGAINAAGKFSILESIELLKRARVIVSNDSAPTHMGICANINVLTLYCSTAPVFGFYPYNGKSSYLSYDDLFCKPCGIHGFAECPLNTFDCAKNLKPGKVILRIKEILND